MVRHGGVIRALVEHFIEIPPSQVVPVSPGSLSIVSFRRGFARLEALNITGGMLVVDAPD